MAEARPDRRKAVAMRYNQGRDHAPRITAKGQGDTADRIIAIAKTHGIPLQEDRDLVQLLRDGDAFHEIAELHDAAYLGENGRRERVPLGEKLSALHLVAVRDA